MTLDPRSAALVALGGALGAVARYALSVWLTRDAFPTGTLVVNTLGTLLLATFLFHSVADGPHGIPLRAFFAIGLLGAFTTMSTFGVETLVLWNQRHATAAAAYVAATLLCTLGAAIFGRALAQMLSRPALAP